MPDCSGRGIETIKWIGEEEGGYVFGAKTQHCAGAIMMYLADGEDCWPGINNDDELGDRLRAHVDWNAPHYECTTDFFENAVERRQQRKATKR